MTGKNYHLLLLTLLFCPTILATTIYKWVDENGVTHYSQEMPPEKQTEKLYSEEIEPKKIGSVSPRISAPDEIDKNELAIAATEITKQDKKQAKMICDSAKHQLNVLETHTRLTRKNEQSGEMERMTEEDRQAQIAVQKERIRLFCVK